jgi:hypothetical protein
MLPDLVERAAEWTTILHSRIMNDAIAQAAFAEALRSMSIQDQNKIQQLLASLGVEQSKVA